jgi:hypothetical protein
MGVCKICGCLTDYHHYFCNIHYPDKLAEIKRLRYQVGKWQLIAREMLHPNKPVMTKKQYARLIEKYKLHI